VARVLVSPDERESALDQLLLAVEQTEMRSLRWGATNSSFAENELIEIAQQASSEDPETLIKELLDRRLLFRLPAPGGGPRYRSRFAEGVRLLASLRQIFPGRRWQAAPNLVADFRVDLRQRRSPRRDRPAEEVIAALAKELQWSAEDRGIAEALLAGAQPLTLAAFQERASAAVLLEAERDRGVVISAGTGSGKTLAYYLPALIRIAREVRPGEYWTKALSLYPRSELLKDQFNAVLRYLSLIGDRAPRRLRIGTFFRPTPGNSSVKNVEGAGWDRFPARGTTTAYVCPFATCPACNARLLWVIDDIRAKQERLVCEHSVVEPASCDFRTLPEQVLLTRQTVQRDPPDILFTTAESLNQRMSDYWSRKAFGVGQQPGRRPFLMLLDEAHTYEGVSGAQAAMVFRRWRHAVGSPVRWVGLSATLLGAPRFFEQLTGVYESTIDEVQPEEHEFERLAAEYQLILRGDPLSKSTLLATSIQASFLLARLMDPEATALAEGRAGHRAFVFTDDLDVTNRLNWDLTDAEDKGLANERSTERAGGAAAFAAGQQWRAIEEIGWDLGQSLGVSRTSSQDSGVSATSELVVATASLEVGFDDDRVGAVIQHKAPYRSASFVQRRGRAGRTPRMRSWMVTVLSDYGRDRQTYQSYERLFDPILEAQTLPFANGYVRRIQAGFAFIDWLATVRPEFRGWWWWAVNGPTRNEDTEAQQLELQRILLLLVEGDPALTDSLRSYLRRALRLSHEELDAILWQPPRSLMLELIPTLRRRLRTGWKLANPRPPDEYDGARVGGPPRPLPEFLPPNLFTDLNLPEVLIEGVNVEPGRSLLIEQALRHLAPGRVTRRFAPHRADTHHWIPVPVEGENTYALPVDQFASVVRPVTEVDVEIEGEQQRVTVYRPWTVALQRAPVARHGRGREGDVQASSNARMDWRSQLVAQGAPLHVETAHDPVWSRVIDRLDFYLHDQRSPLIVRRFALEAEATLVLWQRPNSPPEERERVVRTQFRDRDDPDRPAALGYEAEVDGLRVVFRPLDREQVALDAEEQPALRDWRAAYVRHVLDTDPEIGARTNTFQRDWLLQIYLGAVLVIAEEREIHAQDANQLMRERFDRVVVDRLMDGIFHIDRVAEHPEDGTEDSFEDESARGAAGGGREARLQAELSTLISDEGIRARLIEIVAETWEPRPEPWVNWLHAALHESLSEAARSAALAIAPDYANEDSVRLDLGPEHPAPTGLDPEAWITEAAIGGAGVIEAIANGYASDPRTFFRAFEFALLPSDFELVSRDLDATVRLSTENDEVRAALIATAATENPAERELLLGELRDLLRSHGVSPGHAFLASLNQRLLRPELSESAYSMLNALVSFWDRLEQRHDMALDLRAFGSVAVHAPRIDESVTAADLRSFIDRQAGTALTIAEQVAALTGLLWPRPHELRRQSLGSWSPFRDPGFTDPALVRQLLLRDSVPEIPLSDVLWNSRLDAALARVGVARLVATGEEIRDLQRALLVRLGDPIDVGFLQLYPVVEQLRRDGDGYAATLTLPGVV
jgi:hypothetical protein